jgi:hypothetical protein
MVIRNGECFNPYFKIDSDIANQSIIVDSGLSYSELESSIAKINNLLLPFKERIAQCDRICILYGVLGVIMVSILSVVCGIYVSFILSLVLSFLYIVGLVFLLYKSKKLTSLLVKKTHFNLALILRNENSRLYSKYGLKARPGHLSKWIEIHWVGMKGGINDMEH